LLVSDLVNNALANINAIAVGGAAATEDQTLALSFVNLHIDSLNAAVKKSLYAQYDPILFTFNAVADFVNLGDTVTLPAGWPRALQFLAAIDLCPAFGRQAGADLMKLAAEAKAAILTPAGSPPSTTT
jgi:hypothetical protein